MTDYLWYSVAALVVTVWAVAQHRKNKKVRETIRRAELLLCITDRGRSNMNASDQDARHDCDWFIRIGEDGSGLHRRYCAHCRVILDDLPNNVIILGNYRRAKHTMVASEFLDSTPPSAA